MADNTPAKVMDHHDETKAKPDLRNKTQAELLALVDAHTDKHGPPQPSSDGSKDTLFGWADDGKGVWVLPKSKANFDRFEDVARAQPGLDQCGIMKAAGATFFADWKDSVRARASREQGEGRVLSEEEDRARSASWTGWGETL